MPSEKPQVVAAEVPSHIQEQKPLPHEIEAKKREELLARIQQHREDTKKSKARVFPKDPAVGLPPNKRYVWVNRNEARIVAFRSEGYVIATDDRVNSMWKREDGTHTYGDLILMEIDQELYDAIKIDDQMRAVEGVEGASMFEAFANQSGIPVTRLT